MTGVAARVAALTTAPTASGSSLPGWSGKPVRAHQPRFVGQDDELRPVAYAEQVYRQRAVRGYHLSI